MAKSISNTAEFLSNVYEAARAQGWEANQCIELLRSGKINWKNDDAIRPVAAEFRLGHIAGYLKFTKRDEALAVDKLPAKERSDEQQRAYRASVSAWSHAMQLAGVPNQRTGATRKPRQTTKGGNGRAATNGRAAANSNRQPGATVTATAAAPSTPQALLPVVARVFPKVVDASVDVANFASWLCDTIAAFEKRNPHVKMGDYRTIFHEFVGSVKAAQRAARAA